jgi:putative flavoprotein involved in K+ transport
MKTLERTLDVLVIGGGQAGLALGYYLQQTPYRFQIVEGNARIGESWRKRYDSLVLFTPRALSALPRLPVPGDPAGYATKDEIADYLETYAQHFDLPIVTGTGIQSLERREEGYRAIIRSGASIDARAVVLASGAFQSPAIPPLASGLSVDVRQFTADTYTNPASVPEGTVLVVGDGPSGRDIAAELQGSHTVLLASGHPRRQLPERILGRSSWWWLDKLGIVRVSGNTALGRYLKQIDAFPNKGNTLHDLQCQGVRVLPRLVSAEGTHVSFADGISAEVTAVIWATGYRDNSDWVAIPETKDSRGNFVHQQGIGSIPRFYFIGRPWQRSRGSALLMGVGDDAARIKDHIVAELDVRNQPVGVAPIRTSARSL